MTDAIVISQSETAELPRKILKARRLRATKQIVLVLDRAGWHTSVHLRVPDHVHLLFLPSYSPELQPAEHLWELSDEALANRHFQDLAELMEVQAERCRKLQGQE